ncbi:hypothetical protein [Pseudomonas lundensis]|uniref:hypothetical protein n=1 Tax=Pseudomonas lundensis TaxID=86185 RepID=UPI00089DB2C2|nr:hypothetical protein [Pseudomonas lundensis]
MRPANKGLIFTIAYAAFLVSYGTDASDTKYKPLPDETCSSYNSYLPASATAEDKKAISNLSGHLAVSSSLRYLLGKDSIINDMRIGLGETLFFTKLDSIKKKLEAAQVAYLRGYLSYKESLNKGDMQKYSSEKSEYSNFTARESICSLQALYKSPDTSKVDMIEKFVDALALVEDAKFGNFQIKRESCKVSKSVGTSNSYSEPEHWDGSQFVIIDARFKNLDSEGRLPSEGSLIVLTSDGRELRYDTTETVMQRGYGIYFKSVNPLVTMPTKIVYRIPTDISGEVLWEPGGNAGKKKFWCTFILPKT